MAPLLNCSWWAFH